MFDSLIRGTDNVDTLALRFSWKNGVDLVQVVSIAGGFEVHEKDSHVHRLSVALHGYYLYHELGILGSVS